MNYYSIEFFKFYLKRLQNQFSEGDIRGQEKTILHMINYIKDRESNNKDAYSTKFMKKPKFI